MLFKWLAIGLASLMMMLPVGADVLDISIAMKHINKYRAMHSAPPLTYSSIISQDSLEWAMHMQSKNVFAHSDMKYGENIAMMGTSYNMTFMFTHAVDLFQNELKNYNFEQPGFAMNTGHFTQNVWVGSKELGIGIAPPFVVLHFWPRGNVIGLFDTNVSPLVYKSPPKPVNSQPPPLLPVNYIQSPPLKLVLSPPLKLVPSPQKPVKKSPVDSPKLSPQKTVLSQPKQLPPWPKAYKPPSPKLVNYKSPLLIKQSPFPPWPKAKAYKPPSPGRRMLRPIIA
jgi:hypothetical protein